MEAWQELRSAYQEYLLASKDIRRKRLAAIKKTLSHHTEAEISKLVNKLRETK